MRKDGRRCRRCKGKLPADWKRPFCPLCGARLGSYHVRHERGTVARLIRALSRMTDSPTTGDIVDGSEIADEFERIGRSSLIIFFALHVFTLGLASIIWLIRRLPMMNSISKIDEIMPKSALLTWIASYSVIFICSFAVAMDVIIYGRDFSVSDNAAILEAAVCAAAVYSAVSGHIFLWAREVMIDAIYGGNNDLVRAKAAGFAVSPALLWFASAPYLQYHIDIAIHAKTLADFKSAKYRR
ncbi:hypothetical protein FACS1894167_00580 [Synergistales bacterium]|nr:hypothetical protein FACS1894167_00580 [Synergistales bacterium]